MALCGGAWAVLQLGLFWANGAPPVFDPVTLGYGASAGLVLAVANLSLIECLTHLNVSLGSTIYRLNTIGVIVLSVLVLGEPAGAVKLAGIGCGLLAVWMLYDRRASRGDGPAAGLAIFLWLAVFASALRAVFGVVAKVGLNAGADADTALLIYALLWIPAGLAYARWREGGARLTATKAAYGAVSGALLFGTANSLIAAIQRGEVSTLAPIANLSFVVALAVSAALGMERLTGRKAAAIGCAALAIWLLAGAA